MDLNKESDLLDMVLMIAWSIWRNSNEVWQGGRKLIAAAIYGLATRLLEEYYVAQETPSQTQDPPPESNKWIPPPTRWYKVNTDGAVFSKHKWIGIGVIVRDDQGRVVVTMSKILRAPLGALEVKAKALQVAAVFG
ncbi:uncharacterized protein LOC142606165 [Castanea sativa]|uniref:uncharacterized protein LOC142606165 n=1 Tax=Castanea sativa TaxID=21020 RepID=UPI003F64959B